MREILFRGKQIINGDWVEGNLLVPDLSNRDTQILMSTDTYCIRNVIPSTVGQYTGLTDKNGKKIFEGDIVKITDRNVCFETMAVIEFGNPNGLYNWGWQLKPLENKPFAIEILHWVDMEDSGAFIEVIGNIHDNPELLKGE